MFPWSEALSSQTQCAVWEEGSEATWPCVPGQVCEGGALRSLGVCVPEQVCEEEGSLRLPVYLDRCGGRLSTLVSVD